MMRIPEYSLDLILAGTTKLSVCLHLSRVPQINNCQPLLSAKQSAIQHGSCTNWFNSVVVYAQSLTLQVLLAGWCSQQQMWSPAGTQSCSSIVYTVHEHHARLNFLLVPASQESSSSLPLHHWPPFLSIQQTRSVAVPYRYITPSSYHSTVQLANGRPVRGSQGRL